jgi:hypothetical protein
MANEIQYRHDQASETLYAVIVNSDPASEGRGEYWDASLEAFEPLAVGNWSDYDIGLTETPVGGYRYVGTFPAAISPGIYDVLVFQQGGETPDIDDAMVAEITAIWTGSALQTAEKAMEAILAVVAGVSTFDESTGVATFKKQDGSTTGVSVTVSGVGTRSSAAVS